MKQKKVLVFLLILFSLIGEISYSIDDSDQENQNSVSYYVNAYFSQDIIINNKIIFFDLSSDISNFGDFSDATGDLLDSDDFIFKQEEIDRVRGLERIFSQNFFDNLRKLESKMKKEIIFLDETSDQKNYNIIEVKVNRYHEGEYNLIRNIPSRIFIDFIYTNQRGQKNVKFSKTYKQKSDINAPIESKRLAALSKEIAFDILNYIKKK